MDGNGRACLGIDVGKASHRACAVDVSGTVLLGVGVASRAADVDRVLARAGAGALVVADQKRNIGVLAVARARAAGLPQALRPVAEEGPGAALLRMLASQRDFAVRQGTQAKNRLRVVLLELGPAFEAAVDPSSGWQLAVLSELGGPFGIVGAGRRRFRSVAERAHGATGEASSALWDAARASASSGRPELAAERELCRMLASQVLALSADAAALDGLVAESLAGDEATSACSRCRASAPRPPRRS